MVEMFIAGVVRELVKNCHDYYVDGTMVAAPQGIIMNWKEFYLSECIIRNKKYSGSSGAASSPLASE